MPALEHDLEGRVQRLPKPHSWRAALIPIFEAAMNGIHAVQESGRRGTVGVDIQTGDEGNWQVAVEDDGPGLTDRNFSAFCQLDTTHKIAMGGKGVGRLMWLSAFEEVRVSSIYSTADGQLLRRSFDFRLNNAETIAGLEEGPFGLPGGKPGFFVRMSRPRDAYRRHYEKLTAAQIVEAFLAHFLPVLSLTDAVTLTVSVDGNRRNIGDLIREMVVRRHEAKIDDRARGDFDLLLLECAENVVAGEKRNNYVIAAAHARAVTQQPIDQLIGVSHIGEHDGKRTVLLAVLQGPYLDDHVNQERTDFTFETERDLAELIKAVCLPVIEDFAANAIKQARAEQARQLQEVIRAYPSLSIAPLESLQGFLRPSDRKMDAIYQALSIHKYRADERRKKKIDEVLNASQEQKGAAVPDDLQEKVAEVLAEIGDADRNQLAEYVTRRKVLLDVLETLTGIGETGRFALEDALHTLIIPRKSSTLGEKAMPVAHDLWIIDESLAFAKAVASDVRLKDVAMSGDGVSSDKRPDVVIFDKMIAFGEGVEPDRIFVVEFKRPMREHYDKPLKSQVESYIDGLRSGSIRGPDGRNIRVRENCEFQCFVVADIVGDLERELEFWTPADGGHGRLHQYGGGMPIRGFIEVIQWDRLIARARERNRAFFEQAGLQA